MPPDMLPAKPSDVGEQIVSHVDGGTVEVLDGAVEADGFRRRHFSRGQRRQLYPDNLPLGLPRFCGSPAVCVDYAARMTRRRSKGKPARPYMVRLSIFNLPIWPSA